MTHSGKHKRGFVCIAVSMAVLLVGIVVCTILAAPEAQEADFGTQQSQDSASTPAQDVSAARVSTIAPAMPVELPGSKQHGTYYRAETLESWQYLREESCKAYAITVLEQVHAAQYEFIQAGFLDLSGQSWGCVFTDEGGSSISITLLPERPFSSRSNDNRLVVNVIRYLEIEGLS